jgi:hypothetical protein
MRMRELLDALDSGSQSALFAEARDPEKRNSLRSSPYYAESLQQFRTMGDQLLQEPIRVLPYHLYKLFDTTGDRNAFQHEYFERRRRLDVFAILSLVDGELRYIEALEDILWAICDEYAWSLPAHFGGNSLHIIEDLNRKLIGEKGVLSAVTPEHRTTLDLFSTETGFYLSEITYLLEERLSDLIIYRVRKEVKERILDSYTSLSPSYPWETAEMNWAAVCAGSVGAAAMYLIKDEHTLAPLLHRVLESMDSFLDGFPEDGACLEGVVYWNYGFGFFTAFAALLKQRTAGRVDLMQNEKVKQIALFQQKSYLNENYVTSYSDSSLTSNYMPGLTHHLKRVFAEIEIPDQQFRAGILGDNCFRWMHVIRNLVWSDPALTGADLGDASYYLEQAGIIISRTTIDSRRIAFSAKGGNNDEPHNHNDVGSFIVHAGSQPLWVDPGAGYYTKEYFGEQRYSMIYNSSHGHSVPIVEGKFQEAGKEYQAAVISVNSTEEQDELVLDIAGAYPCRNLLSLKRHFCFDKRKGRLQLEDRYSFGEQPSSITERFVSFLEPVLIEPGAVCLKGHKGENSVLRYDANKVRCEIHREDFVPGDLTREYLFCTDLHILNPGIQETIQIEIDID